MKLNTSVNHAVVQHNEMTMFQKKCTAQANTDFRFFFFFRSGLLIQILTDSFLFSF